MFSWGIVGIDTSSSIVCNVVLFSTRFQGQGSFIFFITNDARFSCEITFVDEVSNKKYAGSWELFGFFFIIAALK